MNSDTPRGSEGTTTMDSGDQAAPEHQPDGPNEEPEPAEASAQAPQPDGTAEQAEPIEVATPVEEAEPASEADPVEEVVPDPDATHRRAPDLSPPPEAEIDPDLTGTRPLAGADDRTGAEWPGHNPAVEAGATAIPTAADDERIREERARRFGLPAQEPEVVVASEPVAAAAPTAAMPTTPAPPTTEPADPFADFDDGPTSRAAAHWWSILISILFIPIAWYLLADGGERTSFSLSNGGALNIAGPIEIGAGALCLFFVLLAARWSSVGAILCGTVGLAAGVAFIAANEQVMDLLLEYQSVLLRLDQLGQNIMDHLTADGTAGRLAIYGFVLIMAGVISHGARRQGRREEKRKAALGL
ncbi:MAG: hypothetical protein ACK5H2_09300 [Beutenbergiaceae bacterium]